MLQAHGLTASGKPLKEVKIEDKDPKRSGNYFQKKKENLEDRARMTEL